MQNPLVISLPIDTRSSTAGDHSLTSKHLTAANERTEPERVTFVLLVEPRLTALV